MSDHFRSFMTYWCSHITDNVEAVCFSGALFVPFCRGLQVLLRNRQLALPGVAHSPDPIELAAPIAADASAACCCVSTLLGNAVIGAAGITGL